MSIKNLPQTLTKPIAWLGVLALSVGGLQVIQQTVPQQAHAASNEITGYVYHDRAGDASVAGDPGVGGITVAFYTEASSNNYTYRGQTTTDSSGRYSFIAPTSGKYIVRVWSPSIGGVPAAQTWASTDQATPRCQQRDQPQNSSGLCEGARDRMTDGRDPEVSPSDTTVPRTFQFMSTVNVGSSAVTASFGFSTKGSFGDAPSAAFNTLIGDQGPGVVYGYVGEGSVAGTAPFLYLGQRWGWYDPPVRESDLGSRNGTDDGIKVKEAGSGSFVSLEGFKFVPGRSYTFSATVAGKISDMGVQVRGWATDPYATTPTKVTGSSSAKVTINIGSGSRSGEANWTAPSNVGKMNWRFVARTSGRQATCPDNTCTANYGNMYYDANGTRLNHGEIEDYTASVSNGGVTIAAQSTGGVPPTINYTVTNSADTSDSITLTAANTAVTSSKEHLISNSSQDMVITSATPAGWKVTGASCGSTSSTLSGNSLTVRPATGTSPTCTFNYAPDISLGGSGLKVTPTGSSPVIANGSASWTATAFVGSSNATPISGQTVTFALVNAPSGVRLSSNSCTTGQNGQCTVPVQVNSTTVGTFQVRASISSGEITGTSTISGFGSSPKPVTFVAGSAVAERSVLDVNPDSRPLVAGKESYTATVTARDAWDHPVSNARIPFTLSGVNGADVSKARITGGNGDGTCTTNDSGVCSVNITSSAAATYAVDVKMPNSSGVSTSIQGSPDSNLSFKAGAIASAEVNVVPDSIKAGEKADVVVTLADANGIPVTGNTLADLVLSLPAELSVVPDSFKDNGDGSYSFQVTGTKAGDYAVGIAPNGVSDSDTLGITHGPISAANSTFDVNPTNVPVSDAGKATMVLSYTLCDQYNNLVTSGVDSSTVGFTASDNSKGGQVVEVPNSFSDAGNGEYTRKVYDTTAETANITGTLGSEVIGAPIPVEFTAGAPDTGKSSFTLSEKNPTVGEEITGTLCLADAFGNRLPGLNPVLDADGLDATGPVEDANPGCYSWTLNSDVPGAFTPVATLPGGFSEDDGAVHYSAGEPDAAKSTLLVTPDVRPLVAGKESYTAVATIKDAKGNLLSGKAVTLTLSGTVDDAKTYLTLGTEKSSGGVITCNTNIQGQCTVTISSTKADVFGITATTPISGIDTEFGADPGLSWKAGAVDPSKSSLTFSPAELPVGDQSVGTLVLADEYGNPISLTPEEIGLGTVDGLTLGAVSEGPAGSYTFTADSEKVGDYSVTANVKPNGASISTPITGKVKFIHDDQGELTLSIRGAKTATTTTVSDGSGIDLATATISVADSRGNPITGLQKFDIVGDKTGFQVVGVVTETGNGNYVFKLASKTAATYAITVTADPGEVTLATPSATDSTEFVAGPVCVTGCTPVNPDDLTRVEMVDNNKMADGKTPDTAKVYAYDKFGNPVTGAVVVSTAGEAALQPQTQNTNTADGTADLAWISVVVGRYSATTTVDGLAINKLEDITFVDTTSPDPGKSYLQIDGADAVVLDGGTKTVGDTFTLTATVISELGNPVKDYPVSFTTVASYGGIVSPDGLSAPSCTTDQAGQCSVTLSSRLVGSYTVAATISVNNAEAAITGSPKTAAFIAGEICNPKVNTCTPVNPANLSRVEVTKNSQPVGGVDEATVYLFDKWGNPVTDPDAEITAVPSTNLKALNPAVTGVTDGELVLQFTSDYAGEHSSAVLVNGEEIPGSPAKLVFAGGLADAGQSFLTVLPETAQQVSKTFAATAKVLDATGLNPVEGELVTFTVVPSVLNTAANAAGFFTETDNATASCTTNSAGVCSVNVTSYVAGDYQVSATIGAQQQIKNSPQTITLVAGDLCILPDPANGIAGNGCVQDPDFPVPADKLTRVEVTRNGALPNGKDQDEVKVYAYDKYGNAVSGVKVSTKADAPLTAQPDIADTNANGQSDIWYTSTRGGTFPAEVLLDGVAPSGSPVALSYGGQADPDK